MELLYNKCQVPLEDHFFNIKAFSSGLQKHPVIVMPDGEKIESVVITHEDNTMHIYQKFIPELYENRELPAQEMWYLTDGERRDSLLIEFTGLPMLKNAPTNDMIVTSEECEIKIEPQIDNIELSFIGSVNGVLDYSCDWADWRYDNEGNIIVKLLPNENSSPRSLSIEFNAPYVSGGPVYFRQVKKFKHTAEEHLNALRDFYEATNLKNKGINWFSNAPLWEWDFCINNTWYGKKWHIDDHVVNLSFGESIGGFLTEEDIITGMLPPSFEVFLDDLDDGNDDISQNGKIDLTGCALSGKIPENIKNNPNWNKYGWSIIPQNPWFGGGFDMENINLCLDNAEVEDFVNNEKTTVFDVLSKNKLTWIFNGGDFEWIFGISDERVNKFLDYKDKGLGLVVTAWPNFGLPNIDYKNYVL